MNRPRLDRTAFIAALPGEARALARLSPLGHTQRADGSRIRLGGMGPEHAEAAARKALADGASALVSWGVAAAVAPIGNPGDLLLPDTVIAADGQTLATDADWRGWLAIRLPSRIRMYEAPLAETIEVCAEARDKAALHAATGALGCDMESAAIARVAAEHDAAFLAVRCVLDDANTSLPIAARAAMDTSGHLQPLALARALAVRPQRMHAELRGLKQLAVAFRAARATLAVAADVLLQGPER